MEIKATGRVEFRLSKSDMEAVESDVKEAKGRAGLPHEVKERMVSRCIEEMGQFGNHAISQRSILRDDGLGLVVLRLGY